MKKLIFSVLVVCFVVGIGFCQSKSLAKTDILPDQKYMIVPVELKNVAATTSVPLEEKTFVLLNIETGQCFIFNRDYKDKHSMGFLQKILVQSWDVDGFSLEFDKVYQTNK